MPVGAASAIKTQLVSEGAHATPAGEPTTAAASQQEQTPRNPGASVRQDKTSAIQVEMIQSTKSNSLPNSDCTL